MLDLDLTQPFCVIQKEDQPEVLVLSGVLAEIKELKQIPRGQGAVDGRGFVDSVSLVPFSQIHEKGYPARKGSERLLTLRVTQAKRYPLEDFLAACPQAEIQMEGELSLSPSEAVYRATVADIIEKEIGQGEGANFVIPRKATGKLKDFSPATALALFARLARTDYGTYWKFVFHTPHQTFVGATPEKHLSVDKGRVVMNPISGTFRKAGLSKDPAEIKQSFLKFLDDPKEINELFMVVDEEIKMMSRMCEGGGMVLGPLMKEMSRLVHTEYLLVGESKRDVVDLLRESMFAATVTGSPVANACRLIEKYEQEPRRYYASSIALIGRDEDGVEYLDSPILIRTLEFAPDGTFQLRVGATLVRDSNPEDEVEETKSKSAAVLGSLLTGSAAPEPRMTDLLAKDPLVLERLNARNQKLSTFWFFKQDQLHGQGPLKGKRFQLIDNEDDFVWMFAHMLDHLGAEAIVTSWSKFDLAKIAASDIVVPGPGPGDPLNPSDAKMALNRAVLKELLDQKRRFVAVCLGHQILCNVLGMRVGKKKELTQGVQKQIDYFGQAEHVGFYNTFTGFWDVALPGVEASFEPELKEIHALRGKYWHAFQFHPESILTTHGLDLIREACVRVASA